MNISYYSCDNSNNSNAKLQTPNVQCAIYNVYVCILYIKYYTGNCTQAQAPATLPNKSRTQTRRQGVCVYTGI